MLKFMHITADMIMKSNKFNCNKVEHSYTYNTNLINNTKYLKDYTCKITREYLPDVINESQSLKLKTNTKSPMIAK